MSDAVDASESELRFRKIRGPPQFGRAGLGVTSHKVIPPAKSSHQYRKFISDTSKEIDEEGNMAKALQLQVQGQWTRWENYIKNDLSWKSVLAMPPNLLSFCLASTYNVLPTPSNLKRWVFVQKHLAFFAVRKYVQPVMSLEPVQPLSNKEDLPTAMTLF